MDAYFIGVDVGTGSVRAALVSTAGVILKVFVQSIRTWNPKKDFYEQSSDDIWRSCVICIKEIIKNIDTENIKGIGFDATCSLVCLDTKGDALSISPTGNDEQNVVLWMDHRASEEAAKINRLNHSLLRYVGGKVSLEMEIPKLLWLKTNMKERCWDKVGLFFDLPDFLTWKATGCESRSLCSTVCKWMYEVNVNGDNKWNENFFKAIEIDDLLNDNSRKIGNVILSPGSPVGRGLSKNSAEELGLKPGTPVGSSLIDAHAGGLGLIGCLVDGINDSFHTRLALICGTSTCHMAVSANPIFVPGVWGPYYSAMIPGMWLSEGGQSATGKLLDHIIETHPATAVVRSKLGNIHVQQYLSNLLEKIAEQKHLKSLTLLTANLHVWPDFHGNRSPVSDSSLKGSVCGLTLSVDEENLALLYLATVQAISYGTRHILETLVKSGYSSIESVLICGGLSKNPLFVQTQADVVNLPVICPNEVESVLLGSAILGACGANYFSNMTNAIRSMGGRGRVIRPNSEMISYHDKKYKVFLSMLEDQLKYREIMNSYNS